MTALRGLKMPVIMSLEEPRPRGTVLGERADRLRVGEPSVPQATHPRIRNRIDGSGLMWSAVTMG